jgi:hypothetical protein
MIACGGIYYGRYTFLDGGSSTKFVVIVHADPKTKRVITCLVTKEFDDKNKTPGCHPKTEKFLIPANNEGFIVDTYLELTRFKEWDSADFQANTISGDFSYERPLSVQTIKAIKDCYKKLQREVSPDFFPLVTT